MKRYPVLAAVMSLALLGSACATKEEVSQIARRVDHLEDGTVTTQAGITALQDDSRDSDLRLQFLEYEAVQRGDPIAPRRSMSTLDPTIEANGGRVVLPEPLGRAPVAVAPRPAGQAPIAPGSAGQPEQSVQPVPAPMATPGGNLPASPSSSASPAPGGLPAPVSPVNQALESAATAVAATSATDVRRGSSTVVEPPSSPASVEPVAVSPAQTPMDPTTVTASRAPAQTEQNAYNAALQLYRSGRFLQAEAAFQAFLEVYPDSPLVANALYWKGETYYARSLFAEAIFAFKDVQTRFPESQKTPDSLLKTAMAYQKLGDTANASLHLSVLYEDWPDSEATQRAKRMGLKP